MVFGLPPHATVLLEIIEALGIRCWLILTDQRFLYLPAVVVSVVKFGLVGIAGRRCWLSSTGAHRR